MKTSNDNLDKIDALEARVTQLETINARLIACVSRFTALLDNHSLALTEWAVDEFTARDTEAAQVQVELEAAIMSRAPRGFKFPITVHQTVVSPVTVIKNTFRKPLDAQTWERWGSHLRYLSGLAETHQIILKKNGLIPEEPPPSGEDY